MAPARATDRSDNIMVYVFDAVAILDTDTFRWGDQPHVFSVKKVAGLIRMRFPASGFSQKSP